MQLVDFVQFSNTQLIQFEVEHFELFASDRREGFPTNLLTGIERGAFVILRRREGVREFDVAIARANFYRMLPALSAGAVGACLVQHLDA